MTERTMTWTAAMAVAACVAATATQAAEPAPASPVTPGGKAVAARQAHYKELNGAFRTINDELRKDPPDKALIASEAAKMKAFATDLPSWFPKGSGPEAGAKTAAKAEIWTDAADFAAAAAALQAETAKLQEASVAGDLDVIKVEARAAGGACKGCHDRFREADRR